MFVWIFSLIHYSLTHLLSLTHSHRHIPLPLHLSFILAQIFFLSSFRSHLPRPPYSPLPVILQDEDFRGEVERCEWNQAEAEKGRLSESVIREMSCVECVVCVVCVFVNIWMNESNPLCQFYAEQKLIQVFHTWAISFSFLSVSLRFVLVHRGQFTRNSSQTFKENETILWGGPKRPSKKFPAPSREESKECCNLIGDVIKVS